MTITVNKHVDFGAAITINICKPLMEKKNDDYLKTLQLEVTKSEITKNYK